MRPIFALLTIIAWTSVSSLRADEVVKTGPEFQVNTYTTSQQGFPEIAVGPEGSFVIAWESLGVDGDEWGVAAQRFSAAGVPIGGEIQVNTTTADVQWDPSVAIDGQGNFVVAWDGYHECDCSDYEVYAQRFDSAGAAVGGEFQVNTYTQGFQGNTSIAATDSGEFFIVWESQAQDLSDGGVYGQLYDSAGVAVGGEMRLNDTTAADQNDVRVVAVESGFAVVWESFLQDSSEEATILRFFDATGAPDGGEMVVNTHTTGDQEDAAVAVTGDGNLAVVWESDAQDGFGEGVYAQVFDSAGVAVGSEMRLNSHTAEDQDEPRVAADGSGGFIAVWRSENQRDGVSDDVYGRRFDATGQLLGDELEVNSQATDHQDLPVIAGGPGQQVMVAWRSFGGHDGDQAGVFAQRLAIALFADGFESGDTNMWSAASP